MEMSQPETGSLKYRVEVFEQLLIRDALRCTHGNCARAAQLLGTTQRILNYKIRKYEIDPKSYEKSCE